MSDYRTHTSFNLLFALPLVIIACSDLLHLAWNSTLTLASCFTYGTLFMSPDLDLAYNIRLGSVRGILAIPFRSYAVLFRHRGLSHSLLFGTVTRLLWLGMFIMAILFLFYEIDPSSKSFTLFFIKHKMTLAAAFGGLFVADACHLLLDRLSS